MPVSLKKMDKAYKLLSSYEGKSPYILHLKNCIDKGYKVLSEFEINYIIENIDYEPKVINKIVKITEDFGKKFADDNNVDFIPEKLLITTIIGEIGNSYHCYVMYRKSIPHPTLTFISKKALLDDIFVNDYKSINIDFSKYNKLTEHLNRKLKPHQEEGVKFLVSRNKAILADSPGLGKSSTIVVSSLAGNYKKVLIICPASLKGTWKRELSYYIKPEDIEIVFGSQWDGNKKYTVMNYDILSNFYTLPLEPEMTVEKYKDENGEEKERVVPLIVKCKGEKGKKGEMEIKMKKSRKKEVIKEALEKSPLFLAQFDLVIIDEIQKLANCTSDRYRILDDFLRRSKPKGIYCVTGTPLTNNPMNLFHILKLIDADISKDYDYYTKRFCNAKEFKKKDGSKITIINGASNLDELREKIKHIYIRRLQTDIQGMVNKQIITRYYSLSPHEMTEYTKLWDEYLYSQYQQGLDMFEYKELIEGGLVRRYLADKMIKNTIALAEEHLEDDEKVFIVCCYDNEVQQLKKHFGNKAVVYDGKKTNKQKDKAEHEFMNNPKIKVFIGQVLAAGVGLTLTESHICIFNTYSWVPTDNWQAMDRVCRLSQTENVTVYYQLFDDDISLNMWEKVMGKEEIINQVIKSESEK